MSNFNAGSTVKNHYRQAVNGNNVFVLSGQSKIGDTPDSNLNILSREIITLLHPDISVPNLNMRFIIPREFQVRNLFITTMVQPNADTLITFYTARAVGTSGNLVTQVIESSKVPIWQYLLTIADFDKDYIDIAPNDFLEVRTDGAATNSPIPLQIMFDIDYIYNNPPIDE